MTRDQQEWRKRRVGRGGRRCRGCDRILPQGSDAYYLAANRTWSCQTCRVRRAAALPGVAGESARAAATRLRAHPERAASFASGGEGEERLAQALERHLGDRPVTLLPDLAVPGGDGNIDLVAIGPAGVFVIDAKHVSGSIDVVQEGWFAERRPILKVRGAQRTGWLQAVQRQVALVTDALEHVALGQAVQGMLCFVGGDFRTLGHPLVEDVWVVVPDAAARRLGAAGPFTQEEIDAACARVLAALPPRRYRARG
jgi:hypothetical protein